MGNTDLDCGFINNSSTCRMEGGMDCRKDESPQTWFRSDRVVRSDGQWFFHTREGAEVGPYQSRFEAEIDAARLKSMLMDAAPDRAMAMIREFVLFADTAPADMNDAAFTDYLVEEGPDSHEARS
jgi:hypothetical protein